MTVATIVNHFPAQRRHFRMSGGGVVVHQTYPEHLLRVIDAVRRRRLAECEVNGQRVL